jgi:WD40 repeat protein
MTSEIVEIGQSQNLLPNIKQADSADILFIGGKHKLMQWSVSQGQATKEYADIMAGDIYSIVQTSDKKYVFLSDDQGC